MKKFFLILFVFLIIGGGIIYVFQRKSLEEVTRNNKSTPIPLPSATPMNSPVGTNKPSITMIKEKLSLLTDDGVKISGIYHKVEGSKIAIILLHMMPATKESWNDFSELLNKNGYSTLAIDLRGHGESTNQNFQNKKKELDYRYFSDEEHQNSILDVISASQFLEKENFSLEQQYVVGASIGSNLALEFLSQNSMVKKAVLLSPGLDYHGLKTEEWLEEVTTSQSILAVASKGDYYSYNSVKELEKKAKELNINFKTIYYKNAGHGTNMFGKEDPDLAESILSFLSNPTSSASSSTQESN